MRLLFSHQNFPGQYRHLIKYYSGQPGCEVACMGESQNMTRWNGIPGVRIHGYGSVREQGQGGHPYLAGFDVQVRRGQKAARTALEIKKSGFEPDVICVHPGWGEGLYLKDVFPDAKIISYCEFYYNANGSDVAFEKRGEPSLDKRLQIRTRNANQLLSILAGDMGVSPTEWQRAQFPEIIQSKISVIHDGIDTGLIKPDSNAHCTLRQNGLKLKAGDEVITFVNRNLEPYRGYHVFMQALPLIQKMRPNAHTLIIGGDGVSYGAHPPKGTTYREIFLNKVRDRLDMGKVHFLGMLPYDQFVKVLQISAAHVYLTYPFVLSWSMLEAMSAGCLVIGSKTAPVEEVLRHGANGLLADFFSPVELAETVALALAGGKNTTELRRQARQTIIKNFDLHSVCLPKLTNMINGLARGESI